MKEIGNSHEEVPFTGTGRPACYGDPEQVSPRDKKGFIQPQKACVVCVFVKSCLQQALRTQGILRTPLADTPVASKMSQFLKRWSDKKLSRNDSPADST